MQSSSVAQECRDEWISPIGEWFVLRAFFYCFVAIFFCWRLLCLARATLLTHGYDLNQFFRYAALCKMNKHVKKKKWNHSAEKRKWSFISTFYLSSMAKHSAAFRDTHNEHTHFNAHHSVCSSVSVSLSPLSGRSALNQTNLYAIKFQWVYNLI